MLRIALAALALALLPALSPMLRAETVEYPIAANADDTHCSSTSNYVGNDLMNFPYNSDAERRPFLRWALGLPAGATVESAYLRVKSGGAGDSNPTTIRLWVVDYDSCPSFSTNPFSWPMMSSPHVDWALPGVFTADQWYTSPDIAALVQAFIERPGYEPGRYLGIRGQHVPGRYKWIYQRDSGAANAAVLEVTWSGGNFPPAAHAGTDQHVVDVGYDGAELVTLNGSASIDSDGTIVSYIWKEGGLQIATGQSAEVTLGAGPHVITLIVTDDDGATDQDTVVVTVHSSWYVDFEGGDDAASGVSPELAWQHCPGDPNATGVPAAMSLVGGDRIVFKGGSIYRGSVACNWSGSPGLPIIYDGNTAGTFGTGMAILDGSEPMTGWTQCQSAADAGGNANWQNIWVAFAPAGINANTSNLYQWDSAAGADTMCWMAQDPNQPDPFFMDSIGGFYSISRYNVTTTSLTDPARLTQADPNYWDGAFVMVWVQPNLVDARTINTFDPATHTITYDTIGSPYTDRDGYYAIYNHVALIDTPGEYYFNDTAEPDGTHRVWLWPPAGDPNASPVTVSAPGRTMAFHFTATRSHLTFDGLAMQKYAGGGGVYRGAGITNNAKNGNSYITITGCDFRHIRHDYRDGNGYGAVVMSGSHILVTGNTFEELPLTNAMQFGGSDSQFSYNYVRKPGRHGLWMTFTNCQILGNYMTDVRGSHADGIAVFNGSSNVDVMYNTIVNSNVPICTQSSTNVTVAYNHLHCPGFYAYADYNGCTNLKVHNNTLRRDDEKPSARLDSVSEFKNNIRYTFAGQGSLTPDADGNLTINHSMDSAVFADPASGDWRLRASSPAVDAALSLGYTEDIEGNPVPMGSGPDIGAFEYLEGATVTGWAVVAVHRGAEVTTPVAEGFIEPRLAGLARLRVTVSEPLDPATVGPAAVSLSGQAAGDLSDRIMAVALDGSSTLDITLSPALVAADWYTATLADSLRTSGGAVIVGDRDLRIGVLAGDADGSGRVGPADLLSVRSEAGQAVTADTARWDLDGSAQITGADVLAVRSRLGNQLP